MYIKRYTDLCAKGHTSFLLWWLFFVFVVVVQNGVIAPVRKSNFSENFIIFD
jgi:hypothetical protein